MLLNNIIKCTYDLVDTRLASFSLLDRFLYTNDKICAVGVLAIMIIAQINVTNQYPLWKIKSKIISK